MSTLKWGKYEADPTPIGNGKQGRLYKGYDPLQKRTVAIKETEDIESSKREAFVMQTYGTHKYLPQYYDFFISNKKAYLVMEWIEGHSLKKKPQQYDEKTAVQITLYLLDGLKQLHGKGYLHCDISRNNVMMSAGVANSVKLIDLGRAVKKGRDHLYKHKHYKREDFVFCPPEQRTSEWWVLDDSSDLYRMAGICVLLMTKKKPALNPSTRAHRCSLTNKNLERVLNKAMHPAREKRYRSAEDLINALKPFA